MRHITLKENVLLLAEKKNIYGKRILDYYILVPEKQKIFAFRRKFSMGTYNLCKNGIRMNKLTHVRTRDKSIMNLVNHIGIMLPYLAEYYDLPLAS